MIAAHIANSPLSEAMTWSIGSVMRIVERSKPVMAVMHPMLAASEEGDMTKTKEPTTFTDPKQAIAMCAAMGFPIKRKGDA